MLFWELMGGTVLLAVVLPLVVAGVAGGYLREAEEVGPKPEPGHP
jgi:hypothetical protein